MLQSHLLSTPRLTSILLLFDSPFCSPPIFFCQFFFFCHQPPIICCCSPSNSDKSNRSCSDTTRLNRIYAQCMACLLFVPSRQPTIDIRLCINGHWKIWLFQGEVSVWNLKIFTGWAPLFAAGGGWEGRKGRAVGTTATWSEMKKVLFILNGRLWCSY